VRVRPPLPRSDWVVRDSLESPPLAEYELEIFNAQHHHMAPGFHSAEPGEHRPAKRLKSEASKSEALSVADGHLATVPTHPLGVKPAGNAYTSATDSKANAGSFSSLPDELVILLLESLKARDLCVLGATCRAMYAFSRAEELWRALFVE
jgi:hypothetical protein